MKSINSRHCIWVAIILTIIAICNTFFYFNVCNVGFQREILLNQMIPCLFMVFIVLLINFLPRKDKTYKSIEIIMMGISVLLIFVAVCKGIHITTATVAIHGMFWLVPGFLLGFLPFCALSVAVFSLYVWIRSIRV